MKRYWKIGLAVGLLISLVLVAISKEISSPFIEMEVKGVRLDAIGQTPVVVLADKEGKKALPIWIGLLEATAIDKELKNMTSPRPMTHDLLHSILNQVQVKVKEVKIVELKDQTYYATLFLKLGKGVIEVDARPSDAIILALKSKIPIFVSAKILDEQGIALARRKPWENDMEFEYRNSPLPWPPTLTLRAKRAYWWQRSSQAVPQKPPESKPGISLLKLIQKRWGVFKNLKKYLTRPRQGIRFGFYFLEMTNFRKSIYC